ncbi:hypothetical protein [Alkaliphilus transvaalensis]|uniref:hypothetical protein n=1 Tax=Alkaliphilus transvaalensis TaxID=114628 RepID=UPI00047C241D|nr:hypothetical protein [Alkaliphilus transvaalensis]
MLKRYKLIVPLIVLALIIFSFAGCGANPEKPEPKENSNTPPEVPEILTEMEDTILETMYAIDSVMGLEVTLQEIEKLKAEITQESEVDQEKQEKEDSAMDMIDVNRVIMENAIIIPILEEEEVEGDEMIDPHKPPQEVDDLWFKIQQNIYTIHRQWNVLERHLKDADVPNEQLQELEELLEELTKNLDAKEVEASLFTSNEILGKLADYRNHFKSKVPFEMYMLRYQSRKSVLLSNEEEYEAALEEAEKMKELINGLRQRVIEKDGEEELDKLVLSLEDLQHEISTENFHLVQIKAAIFMKNIELVQTPFEAGN